MRCPSCASLDTQVKDSRPTEDSSAIRRRRLCLACGSRFTTFERVQLREIAVRKRNVAPELVEQTVSKIVRDLENLGENEVTSETIGETVMAHLRGLDDVAYVRFASVYRNFREAKDFETVLDELAGEEDEKPLAPNPARK